MSESCPSVQWAVFAAMKCNEKQCKPMTATDSVCTSEIAVESDVRKLSKCAVSSVCCNEIAVESSIQTVLIEWLHSARRTYVHQFWQLFYCVVQLNCMSCIGVEWMSCLKLNEWSPIRLCETNCMKLKTAVYFFKKAIKGAYFFWF